MLKLTWKGACFHTDAQSREVLKLGFGDEYTIQTECVFYVCVSCLMGWLTGCTVPISSIGPLQVMSLLVSCRRCSWLLQQDEHYVYKSTGYMIC